MLDVSVIIVVRNEEDYIVDCIKSVETQFDSGDIWELIIVDGESDDNTKKIANEYLEKQTYASKLLDNPKKVLSAGWNMGIKEAQGKFVVRPDAHATLHSSYIKEGIKTLESKLDVTAVGGVLETKSRGFWGNIIRVALSSKVGVGNSSFRTGAKSGEADTAVYAVYRKEIFDKVGYFDENLVRHQDNDMHSRIKNENGKLYLNVNMVADYYCRDSVPKLMKQMFQIGRYLPDVLFDGSLSLRHLAPVCFYLGVFFCIGLGLLVNSIFVKIAIIVFGIYLLAISCDMIIKGVKEKNSGIFLNIIIIPLMHFQYACGTIVGLVKKIA